MENKEIHTKDKIINAAFSLLRDNTYSKLSLSQIAKEVGISKTAIYRHFKNKEDLENEIQRRIYSESLQLAASLRPVYDEKNYFECINQVIDFFNEHREYLFYSLFSSPKIGEDYHIYEFRNEKLKIFDAVFDQDFNIKNYNLYVSGIFITGTLIDFLLAYFKCGKNKKLENVDFDTYKNNIITLLDSGLFGAENKKIECSLFEGIDELCVASLDEIKPLDKKLVALSSVISKVGFPNVTVESVANELGLAKSSLYSWFSNKSEMILSLVSEEVNLMLSVILKNLQNLKSYEERLYAILKTELLYFIQRKETLTVFKWLQISGDYENSEFNNLVKKEIQEELNKALIPDPTLIVEVKGRFPFFDYSLLTGWIFSFPVYLVINAQTHKFPENEIKNGLRKIYMLILEGLNLKKISKKGENKYEESI